MSHSNVKTSASLYTDCWRWGFSRQWVSGNTTGTVPSRVRQSGAELCRLKRATGKVAHVSLYPARSADRFCAAIFLLICVGMAHNTVLSNFDVDGICFDSKPFFCHFPSEREAAAASCLCHVTCLML
ncbi:hypothetical protein AMECASPLE_031206 [Ameca splendens]|uniref:Uncharacterized protein n=1 Tax=Ameca splendens TaxID=208324 RepID=A0ABV0YHZ7_9TELE